MEFYYIDSLYHSVLQCLSSLSLKISKDFEVTIFSGNEFQSSMILWLNSCFLSSKIFKSLLVHCCIEGRPCVLLWAGCVISHTHNIPNLQWFSILVWTSDSGAYHGYIIPLLIIYAVLLPASWRLTRKHTSQPDYLRIF